MSLRQLAVAGLTELVDRSGFRRAVEFQARHRIAILCYHSIVDGPLPKRAARAGLHLHQSAFVEQMEYLARHFEVMPLASALTGLSDGSVFAARRTRPAVVITFDDGYANNLHVAGPVLDRLGLPATVFLVTRLLGDPHPFWWDEVNLVLGEAGRVRGPDSTAGPLDLTTPDALERTSGRVRDALMTMPLPGRRPLLDLIGEVASAKPSEAIRDLLRPLRREELADFPPRITFANHTATHRVLDLIDPDAVSWEVSTAANDLDQFAPTRFVPHILCYPRGASGVAVQNVATEAGCRWGLGLATGGKRTVGLESQTINLPRQFIAPRFRLARFKAILAGLP